MGSPAKPGAEKGGTLSDSERRLEMAAELLARIAVRVASEKPKPTENATEADENRKSEAA